MALAANGCLLTRITPLAKCRDVSVSNFVAHNILHSETFLRVSKPSVLETSDTKSGLSETKNKRLGKESPRLTKKSSSVLEDRSDSPVIRSLHNTHRDASDKIIATDRNRTDAGSRGNSPTVERGSKRKRRCSASMEKPSRTKVRSFPDLSMQNSGRASHNHAAVFFATSDLLVRQTL